MKNCLESQYKFFCRSKCQVMIIKLLKDQFQKEISSLLQFGEEQNILSHSFEFRAYLFLLKTARLFHSPTRRVEKG